MGNNQIKKVNQELAGAVSKQRNFFEIQWGILKILDTYKEFLDKKIKDFFVVFDYKCDIEVHKNNNDQNEIYYYQVKTKDKEDHTINKLFKLEIGKQNSIIGTLYKLKIEDKELVKLLAIVSNRYLKHNKKIHNESTQINLENWFDDLNEKQEYIEKINNELNIDYFKLSDIEYIYTELPLKKPESTVIGELVIFFDEILGEQIINESAIYNTINSSAIEKSKITMQTNNDQSLKEEKSISKDEFENIIKIHLNNSKKSAQKIINFAKEQKFNIQQINEIKNELAIMKSNDFFLSSKIEETVDNLKQEIEIKFGYLRINDITFEMIKTEILPECDHFFDSNTHNEVYKIILIIRALIMIYEL